VTPEAHQREESRVKWPSLTNSCSEPLYEYSARPNGLNSLAVTGIIVRGISVRRNLEQTGGLAIGRNSYVYNSEADEASEHNVYAEAGSQFYGLTMNEGYWVSAGVGALPVMFVAYDANPGGLPSASCTNCIASISSSSPVQIGGSGFFSHNSAGTSSVVTFINCTSSGLFYGFGASNTNLLSITSSTVTLPNTTNAAAVIASTPTNINGLTVNINTAGGGSAVYINVNNLNVNVSGLVETVVNAFTSRGIYSTNTGLTVNLSSSTLTKTGNAVSLTGASSTVNLTHNSYVNQQYRFYDLEGASSTLNLYSNYNAFNGGTAGFDIGGTVYSNLTAYRTATGQDASSTP
jgi:hypothetical protein